jgi:hypothetical protein
VLKCQELLDSANGNENFLKNIITGDETWVCGCEVEMWVCECDVEMWVCGCDVEMWVCGCDVDMWV